MTNPFNAKYIRPGAMAYICPPQTSISRLTDCFISCACRGQVIGPHGAGKSSLLISLEKELLRRGYPVKSVVLNSLQRRLPPEALNVPTKGILIIDGFEQLSFFRRQIVLFLCYWKRWGLLISSHRSVGLPTLWETRMDAVFARALVEELIETNANLSSKSKADCLSELPDLEPLLLSHNGNLREVFFDLYDWYEKAVSSLSG